MDSQKISRRICAAITIVLVGACVLIAAMHLPDYPDKTSTSMPRMSMTVERVDEDCMDAERNCHEKYTGHVGAREVTVSGRKSFRVSQGQEVIVSYDESQDRFHYADSERKGSMYLWGLAAYVLLVIVGGLTGFRALIGLSTILATLLMFVVPLISSGQHFLVPSMCAMIAAMAVALFVSHGVRYKTASAFLSTACTFVLAALLTWAGLVTMHISSEWAMGEDALALFDAGVDLQALVIFCTVLGILGGLNDMTITQSSAVSVMGSLGAGQKMRRAMVIGRDHLASSVYTLALSYLGASIPYYIAVFVAARSVGEIAFGTVVAAEIMRSCVTVIALCLCVPLSTAIAIATTSGQDGSEAEDDESACAAHGH